MYIRILTKHREMAAPHSPPRKKARKSRSNLTTSSAFSCSDDVLRDDAMPNFFEKLKGKRIYVNTKNDIPDKVWFMSKGMAPIKGDEYKIVDHGNPIPSWALTHNDISEAGQKMDGTYMAAINAILHQVAKSLQWDRKKWITNPDEALIYHSLLTKLQEKDEISAYLLSDGNLLRALKLGLTSAQGWTAIKSLLQIACRASFGRNSIKLLDVINVGSSRAPHESFPIDVVPVVRDSVQQSYNFRSSSSGCSDAYEDGSIDPEDSFGEMYTDIIVLTCDKPLFPHVVLVAEIKSEPLNRRQMGQVVCQMLAPMMNQNMCFGLLISPTTAYLYLLQRDQNEEKRLNLYCHYYQFIYALDGCQKFSGEQLQSVFSDIVASLRYSKINVQDVIKKIDPDDENNDKPVTE